MLYLKLFDYVYDPRMQKIFLQEDKQAVVYVLNVMVSASKPMMEELRKLEVMSRVMGIKLESGWIQ